MSRNNVIMWLGRIATLIFTIAVILDIQRDETFSEGLRLTVLVLVLAVFLSLASWQVYIAQKYDGFPVIPLSFRWVVAAWLASFSVYVGWIVLVTVHEGVYTDLRSAVIWWQFGSASLWFASRWIAVQTPHPAGPGETGTSPGG